MPRAAGQNERTNWNTPRPECRCVNAGDVFDVVFRSVCGRSPPARQKSMPSTGDAQHAKLATRNHRRREYDTSGTVAGAGRVVANPDRAREPNGWSANGAKSSHTHHCRPHAALQLLEREYRCLIVDKIPAHKQVLKSSSLFRV